MREIYRIIWQEQEKAEQFPDKEEGAKRLQLLQEIEEQCYEYETHIRDYRLMQYISELKQRGIIFNRIEDARGVKANWSRHFASAISKEDKKRVYYEDFKWHLFSYELLEAEKGDRARRAFDATEKHEVYMFFQHEKEGYHIENAHLLKAEDFEEEAIPSSKVDMYIFNPKGKWTYIHTHEGECGPYFYQK